MLEDYLQNYPYLNVEEVEAFVNSFAPLNLRKGDFFITEGQISKHIAFVKSGIFRSFYHSSEIEPVTYCFTFENALITAYTSWIRQEPANENIEALTDMELLLISKESVDNLENRYPNWIKFFKQIAEQEYINLEQRIFMLQRESAETRYYHLMENYPEYLHKIPLNYLASYLGITQRHLSRIRRSISY